MRQNLLTTAVTPLSLKTETNSWENRPFTTVWPEKIQHKPKDITRTIKKKPKRVRTAFSTEQILSLERTFSRHKYINCEERNVLAKSLNIAEKCIKVWFQNRRMKEKRESESSDSSSESYSEKTPSLPPSPEPQVKTNMKTDYPNPYYHCNNTEYYQLPTYYPMQQNMYETQNVATFHNDNNVYPTHYFPYNTNYSNAEVDNNMYGNEISQYWMANQHSYYAQI